MINDSTILDPSIDRRLAIDIDAAEADRLEAYQDSLGFWTIGRGHLLPPAAPGKSWAGFTIIQPTSDRYFNGDLLSALLYARTLPEWEKMDTQCRQNALTEICFNMRGKWHTFVNTRAAMMQQDWQAVHDGLLDSLWAKQVHGRAERIADQFLDGKYGL